MAVGYRIKHLVPQLVVNQAGWHRFLALIRHLRDSCVWFYVTRPNTARWNHLPFLLTTPYLGTNSHGELLAIECIRLEPEDWIFLDGRGRLDPLNRPSHPQLSQIEIRGNSAGLLLLAQWIRSFAKSSLESQDILNPWKNGFSTHAYDKQKYPPEDLPLRKFCFRKMFPNSSTPVLAMGVQKAETDCFVFGNPSGLEEWADLIEKSAFRSSYDVFSSAPTQPGYFRNRGDVSIDFTAPEEIYLSCGWDLLEGGFYNPIYNEEAKCFYQPNFKERPLEERKRQFINERICHDHTN